MLRLKLGTKVLIILAIFVVAIVLSIKTSNLLTENSKKIMISKDELGTAKRKFDNLPVKKKIIYSFERAQPIRDKIDNLFKNELIKTIYSSSEKNYSLIIIQFPDSIRNEVITEIRAIDGMISEKIFTETNEKFNINFEERIKLSKNQKSKYQELRNNTTIDGVARNLNKQINLVQAKIDSLKELEREKEIYQNSNLAFIKSKVQDKKDNILLDRLLQFAINTFIYLVVLLIGLIILYFILLLLIKFMEGLGIKTVKPTSRRYGYYSRKKKKIKAKSEDNNNNKSK